MRFFRVMSIVTPKLWWGVQANFGWAGFYVDRYFHPCTSHTYMVVESLGGEFIEFNIGAVP